MNWPCQLSFVINHIKVSLSEDSSAHHPLERGHPQEEALGLAGSPRPLTGRVPRLLKVPCKPTEMGQTEGNNTV